jgi:hypothetical protein
MYDGNELPHVLERIHTNFYVENEYENTSNKQINLTIEELTDKNVKP